MTNVQDQAAARQVAPPFRDLDGNLEERFVEIVAAAVESGDSELLSDLISELHEADQATLLEALHSDLRPTLIELLGSDFDFAALTEVDDSVREEILEELDTETLVEGVRELDSDDAVYILEDLNKEDQEEILDALPALDRVALQKSLDYPEGSAARLMQTDLIAVPPFWTVGQVIDHLGDTTDLPDSFFEVFVVDPGYRLLGNVFLDRLVRSKRTARIEELMASDRRRVSVDEDRETVALLFGRYNLVSVPVVDEAGRLVGVVTIDDIVDVIQDDADDEIKALGGVKGDEELSDSIFATAKSRVGWVCFYLF